MTKQPDWLDSLDAIQDTFGDCGTLRVLTLRKTQVRRCVGSPWDHVIPYREPAYCVAELGLGQWSFDPA